MNFGADEMLNHSEELRSVSVIHSLFFNEVFIAVLL